MTYQFTIPNLACGACAGTVTKAVHSLDPAASIQADLKTKQVMVNTQSNEAELRSAIAAVGYPAA